MDIYDMATAVEERDRELALKNARSKNNEAEATGHCLYCNAELSMSRRWCDTSCREDWELAKYSNTRHKGRF